MDKTIDGIMELWKGVCKVIIEVSMKFMQSVICFPTPYSHGTKGIIPTKNPRKGILCVPAEFGVLQGVCQQYFCVGGRDLVCVGGISSHATRVAICKLAPTRCPDFLNSRRVAWLSNDFF